LLYICLKEKIVSDRRRDAGNFPSDFDIRVTDEGNRYFSQLAADVGNRSTAERTQLEKLINACPALPRLGGG